MKKFIFTFVVLLFSVSLNAQWEPDVRLTNAESNSWTTNNNAWCIAAKENVVHITWGDIRDGDREIYYKRSTDGGTTWGADIRLTNTISYSEGPSIAVSDSHVHVVWQDYRDGNYEIYSKHSTDGGITWGNDIRQTKNINTSLSPCIASSGLLVHIVWHDERDYNYPYKSEIYYKRSTDGGLTWGEDIRLTFSVSYSAYSSIVVSGSLMHLVWMDNRDGLGEIYYKRSTDSGINWGADTRLTNEYYDSWSPSIAASGKLVHIVWSDSRNGYDEIYYKRSTDDGITWGADNRLTNAPFNSNSPSVAVSDKLVHVAWDDWRDNDREIYYKRSTNGGITWGVDTRLTNAIYNSERPSIAVSGSHVNVVWTDSRNGYINSEIYYKRNPTGNVGIRNIKTEIPSAFSLNQNYPNPFNPKTVIRFSLSVVSNAVLKVYDAMGREVETLVNESLQPGTYSVDWNASDFPSGVYFYRLQTESFTETKRMTLIK